MSTMNSRPLTECDLALRTDGRGSRVLEVHARTEQDEVVLSLSDDHLAAVDTLVGETPTPGVWIFVSTSLPEYGVDILVATPCGVGCGWMTPAGWTILGPVGDDADAVTHWQPLPIAPEVSP